MLEVIELYFLLFISYAFLGWCMEVICKLIQYKRFINRGFLIGPYCPIYGWGALLITILLQKYNNDPLTLFILAMVICSILEYVTSYFMEKIFKARWWDYSKRKFNLNGRVCLGPLIPFGIFGVILTYVTNPILVNALNSVSPKTLNIIAIILLAIFCIDNIISTIIIIGFRKTAVIIEREQKQDDTEQITKKVKEILLQKSWGYRRLIDAFPSLQAIKNKIQEIKVEVKENVNEIKDNLNEKAEDIKTVINDKKEEMKGKINDKITKKS